MPISLFPWELSLKVIQDHLSKKYLKEQNIFIAISCSDSLLQTQIVHKFIYVLSKLKKITDPSFEEFEREFFSIKDVTLNFIDQHFSSLLGNLLFEHHPLIILNQCEQIEKELSLKLLKIMNQSNSLITSSASSEINKITILLFTKENEAKSKHNFYSEILKVPNLFSLTIKVPSYWQYSYLLKDWQRELSLNLSERVIEYLVNRSHGSPTPIYDLYQNMSFIALEFGEKKDEDRLTIEKINPLLLPSSLDKFHMATLYSEKKLDKFFQFFKRLIQIVDEGLTFSDLVPFFSFMQNHLYKILIRKLNGDKKDEGGSVDEKNNGPKNRYEKEIEIASSKWRQNELQNEIKFFARYETLAKQKNPTLFVLLKQRYVKIQMEQRKLFS